MGRLRIGRRTTQAFVFGVTAVASSALFAGAAVAGSDDGRDKLPMTAVGQVQCDGSTPAGKARDSFATIKVNGNGEDAKVVAAVSIRDAQPDKEYRVVLTQTKTDSSCGGTDTQVTTDKDGDANVRLSAKKGQDRTGAFVIVDGPGPTLVSEHMDFD